MQKVNKNIKECGIYTVIKIHKFTVYEKCQWWSGAPKWHDDKLQCSDGKEQPFFLDKIFH